MRLPIWRAALWKWEPPAKDWLASSSCEAFHLMRVPQGAHGLVGESPAFSRDRAELWGWAPS